VVISTSKRQPRYDFEISSDVYHVWVLPRNAMARELDRAGFEATVKAVLYVTVALHASPHVSNNRIGNIVGS